MTVPDPAVLALEQRVQAKIDTQLSQLDTALAAALVPPVEAGDEVTATEILSRPEVHAALLAALAAASVAVVAAISAGFLAAAALALASVGLQLRRLGFPVPTELPELDRQYIERLVADMERLFSSGLLDVHDAMRAGYDGITGPRPGRARRTAVQTALRRVNRRMRVSTHAAASAAVNRGFTDAQLALWAQFAEAHRALVLRKRWHAEPDACPVCRALHDDVLPLDGEFDHGASDDAEARVPPVYGDLQGPPRHPACRCRLVLEISPR